VRALRLTLRFQRDLRELAPRGSPAWGAVKRALAELAQERTLPRDDDVIVAVPRRVPGRIVPEAALVIGYIPAPDELHAITLTPFP
jgi:hypothetical protein